MSTNFNFSIQSIQVQINNVPITNQLCVNNDPVLTTAQVAAFYETITDRIKQNYGRNKSRFVIGQHYFELRGNDLKQFKDLVSNCAQVDKRTPVLYLWTKQGTFQHAKMLNTDRAWEVYNLLMENYFNSKTEPMQLPKLTQTEIIAYLANNQVQIEKTLSDHTAHLQLQDAEIKKIADFMYDLSETHRKRVDQLQDRITQLAKSQEPPYPMPDLVETTKLQMRVYNICSWYYKKDPSITMQQYIDGFNETLTAWLKRKYNILPAAELFKLRQAYVTASAVGGVQQVDNISLCHLATTRKEWLQTAHEVCFTLECYYRAQYKH